MRREKLQLQLLRLFPTLQTKPMDPRQQNQTGALRTASSDTVRVRQAIPSSLNTGAETRYQRRNQLASDATVSIPKSDDVITSCDVTTQHPWAFEISNTTSVNLQLLQFATDRSTFIPNR